MRTRPHPSPALVLACLFSLLSLPLAGSPAPAASRLPFAAIAPPAMRRSAAVPFAFEENRGQAPGAVKFLARLPGGALALTSDSSALTCGGAAGGASVRFRLVGSSPAAQATGEGPMPGRVNYLRGRDRSAWHTGVRRWRQVRFSGVYPGIDLVHYLGGAGGAATLEHDFLVAPGADPARIRLSVEGADAVRLDRQGDLILETPLGPVRQRCPVAYQAEGGRRSVVRARYRLSAAGRRHEVAFELGRYDRSRTLVIDPVLDYSTFLGGSQGDQVMGIAVDGDGAAYVVGSTASPDFPIRAGFRSGPGGSTDAFVAKLDAQGSLVYATYLGGSGSDLGSGIVVDAQGQAAVAGTTSSTDFPVASPLQPQLAGGSDAFVCRLNAAGSGLVFSTYLGGNSSALGATEGGNGIALAPNGDLLVTGAAADGFPTLNALQPDFAGGETAIVCDAFLARLSPAGALLFSTYLGGGAADFGLGVTSDSAGNGYVTGQTRSTNLIGAANLPGGGTSDAFLAAVRADGKQLLQPSLYLGGNGSDTGYAVRLDPSGNAVVVGNTGSANFPTLHALQSRRRGFSDAFLTGVQPGAGGLAFSTYLGCGSFNGDDTAYSLALDAAGNLYVAGRANGFDFPGAAPPADFENGFLAKLTLGAGSLVYGVLLGGGLRDEARGVALDSLGVPIVAGWTESADFPAVAAAQAAFAGSTDGFIARVASAEPPLPAGTVTLTATDADAVEGKIDSGVIVISRGGDTSQPLTVNVALAGTATGGDDFRNPQCGALVIPADTGALAILIDPVSDLAGEGPETVAYTLLPGDGYTVGTPSSGTVTIHDPGEPPAPTGVQAAAVSSTAVDVTWTDTSSSETGFDVERTVGDTVTLLAAGPNVTVLHDTGLPPDRSITYRVRARTVAALSPFSAPASARTPPGSLTVSPRTLDFGTVRRNRRRTLAVTLRNARDSAVRASISRLSPPFSVRPSGSVTVPAGRSVELRVTFAPTRRGSATGAFRVSVAGAPPKVVRLRGRGN